MRPLRGLAATTWTASLAIGGGIAAYATLVEPRRLSLSFVRLVDPRVRSRVRVLLLSDTHASPGSSATFDRAARAGEWAREHGAGAAVIAGDLIDDDRHATSVGERLRAALAPLRVLYTTGNHETADERRPRFPFGRNATERAVAGFDAAGLERLDGRDLELGGVRVVGVGWPGWAPGVPQGALDLIRAGAPALVITHSPDHVFGLPADHVLLALCGHTHGGQVRLPVVGAPWTPVSSDLPRLAGAMRLAGISSYVSRGIGHTVPVRLGSVPEATLVEVAPDRSSRVPRGVRRVEL